MKQRGYGANDFDDGILEWFRVDMVFGMIRRHVGLICPKSIILELTDQVDDPKITLVPLTMLKQPSRYSAGACSHTPVVALFRWHMYVGTLSESAGGSFHIKLSGTGNGYIHRISPGRSRLQHGVETRWELRCVRSSIDKEEYKELLGSETSGDYLA